MPTGSRPAGACAAVGGNPLQAAKLGGISLALLLGSLGFFRVVDPRGVVGAHPLVDGQFLALLLVPLASLALVAVVLAETAVAGYRALRADASLRAQAADRPGYLAVRSVEAGVAVLGLVLVLLAVPVLLAAATPAPVGVGIMLGLLAVGVGILAASLLRSAAELVYFRGV